MSKFNWGMRACGIFLLWAATAIALPAQNFSTIYTFTGSNFTYVCSGLVQGVDGNLYGVTNTGGNSNGGIFFKITPNGTLTTLYNFCSLPNCADGEYPVGGALALGTDGNFYGTTDRGGTVVNNGCPLGCGTVFKITSTGSVTTLHSFGQGDDGQYPLGGLIQGADGSFYGATAFGGANRVCLDSYGRTGCGAIFKSTSTGVVTTLYSFCPQHGSCVDGELPEGGVIQGSDGNFYGTTFEGGNTMNGTVFAVTPAGQLTTLYSFCPQKPCTDGSEPEAGLVQGSDGSIYGTTYIGGNDFGTIFKIPPGGNLTTLYKFCPNAEPCPDGASPIAPLIQATDGNYYGTTFNGGQTDSGRIFKITPSGEYTIVYSFPTSNEASGPRAPLVQRTDGRFFGTTFGAQGYTDATIFRLNENLPAFVRTIPTSSGVGSAVRILGTNLTGATKVTFNGTPATFTMKSESWITTTVPTGATTGTVEVVTPGGTLSSNVPFTVTP